MDQIPKPPYNNSDLEFFAQRQLGQHPVPEGYIKQLRNHLKFYKYDYLFRLTPHGGEGYGVIDCLEPGCDGKNIVLQPRTTVPDGGRSSGVGGLAAFQLHIIDDNKNHEGLRDRRLEKEERKREARHHQAASATQNGSATSGTKASVTANAPLMTQPRGIAKASLPTQARVPAKDPVVTQAQAGGSAKASLTTQARIPAKEPATTQVQDTATRGMTKPAQPIQARAAPKNPVTTQVQARGIARASLPTQARVPAKNLASTWAHPRDTGKASLPKTQDTAKASTSGVSSRSGTVQPQAARPPAPPSKISQVNGSSTTSSKRPPSTPSEDSSIGAKKRKTQPEIVALSKPRHLVPSKGLMVPPIASPSTTAGPSTPSASERSHDLMDVDSEAAPEDLVWLDGEGLVPCSRLWPKESSIPQATTSSAGGFDAVRNSPSLPPLPSLPQSPIWPYPSTSRPTSNFGAPAPTAYHNSQYSMVSASGPPPHVIPAPQVAQSPGWPNLPNLAPPHLRGAIHAHPPHWNPYNLPLHVAQPLAALRDQRAPLPPPARPYFGHQFGAHPAPQVTNPLGAPQNHHAAQLPPPYSTLNSPSIPASTSTTKPVPKHPMSKAVGNLGCQKTPILNRKSTASTPYSALSDRSGKASSSHMTPEGLSPLNSSLSDLSIIPLKFSRKKKVPILDVLDPFAGPAPMMTEAERQQFFKSAADNSAFEHNTTIEKARSDLGITGTDSYMEGLAVQLLPHQLLGVSWMLKEERGHHSGGLLADEMGMGKTLQMIATMVKNSSTNPKIKSTLIVAPLALLEQWKEEIKTRSTREFKILIYHSSHSKPTSRKLIANHDVVITTMTTLSRDWYDDEVSANKLRKEGIVDDEDILINKRMGPLFNIEWYRVVIDEAQNIRNPLTMASRAVCGLKATYRWCLTGTPIFNGLWDIYPLLRFLRVRPYHDRTEFRKHIAVHEKKNPNLATTRAQAVLLTCMLRRQKHSKLDGKLLLILPPKTTQDQMLEMSTDEREVYDMVEKKMQDKFNKFLKRGTVLKNYANVFVMLLRLRQACAHPSLVLEESGEPIEGEPELDRLALQDASSELARALSKMGQEWVDKVKKKFQDEAAELVEAEKNDPTSASVPECPICNDPLEDSARITKCTHVFCEGCIDKIIEQVDPGLVADERPANPDMIKKPCPNCRAPFGRADTFLRKAFLPPADDDEDEDEDLPDMSCLAGRKRRNGVLDDSDTESLSSPDPKGKGKAVDPPMSDFTPSAKMVWLLEELERVKAKNPGDKTIIISQWTSMLELVAMFLSRNGYRHVLYQGGMSIAQRNEAVATFVKDSNVPVMLMSLNCGGVGLNLTVANRVISLDLAWSPATEAQAFDRVHRVGQVKDVFVNRVMINNTVEQRICELQRTKQNITDSALGEGTGKRLTRMTVSELSRMFNLDTSGNRLA